MKRRDFIWKTTLAAGGAGLVFEAFSKIAERRALGQIVDAPSRARSGELIPVAALNTNETHLALPRGFRYQVLGKAGKAMSDDRPTPYAHDGMGLFGVRNEWRIVRNHEINDKQPKTQVAIGAGNHYDETAGGGTTTLVIDPVRREVVRDFVSLSGTLNNCAGGMTPWGSWISCEETTLGQTKFTAADGREVGGFAKPHGYCFEVRASANGNSKPVPLVAMGRFAHEAVAFDEKSGVVYQTEDQNEAGFYRFLPNRHKHLEKGGRLEVLAVKGKPNFDARGAQKGGLRLKAHWLPINEPNPAEADVDPSAVYKQGMSGGAALFTRLEGCFAAPNGGVYFTSTNGGGCQGGQIWHYQAEGRDEGTLSLVFESPDRETLDMPDNICLHPKKNWLLMCEDSDYGLAGATPENYLRILMPDGRLLNFAKNISPRKEMSEFTGAVFSPDGETLFVNIQTAGITLAVWGNWAAIN